MVMRTATVADTTMTIPSRLPGHAIVLLGPPGSGKSTQADLFARAFDAVHIDIGGALRRAAQEPTPFGAEVNETIHVRKELVSDEVVRSVLHREFEAIPSDRMAVIDGAPRCESQIADVMSVVSEAGRTLLGAIFIELPVEVSVDRISRRFSCAECGRKLILGTDVFSAEDPCPVCGGAIAQRVDDTGEGVRKRWQVFHDSTLPVLRYFEREGKLVRVSGQHAAEEIFSDIRQRLGL